MKPARTASRSGRSLYCGSVRSPGLIQPIFRKNRPKAQVRTAGRTKEIRISPTQSKAVGAMAAAPLARAASLGLTQPVQTPSWPHRPQVPMPELMGSPFISSLKKQVARGPVTAEVRMAGSQMRGFFTMLGICSMEVPMPWLTSPPQRFSRKLITAKPTICAQQPAVAAPPARPSRYQKSMIRNLSCYFFAGGQ